MCEKFEPAHQSLMYPLGAEGRPSTQLDFYDALTRPDCDMTDIAAILDPIIASAQMEPIELCDLVENQNQ